MSSSPSASACFEVRHRESTKALSSAANMSHRDGGRQ
jgi:hypothetical protein